jgi:hypothetical protein
MAELTAAMKMKGGNANYGAPNSVATVIGEIYRAHTGVQAVEVNYRSGPDMLNDLTSGRLDYAAADPVFSLAQSREGRIRITSDRSVVLVEQNVHQSLRLADRVYVLENGRIVRSGSQAEMREDAIIQQAYLGLKAQRPTLS